MQQQTLRLGARGRLLPRPAPATGHLRQARESGFSLGTPAFCKSCAKTPWNNFVHCPGRFRRTGIRSPRPFDRIWDPDLNSFNALRE